MNRQVVLITGASGFIGTALIARLDKKYYIIGIDKVYIRTEIVACYGTKPIYLTKTF